MTGTLPPLYEFLRTQMEAYKADPNKTFAKLDAIGGPLVCFTVPRRLESFTFFFFLVVYG